MSAVHVVTAAPAGPLPKVSVLVTTYNHERFLADALDSALAQEASFPFEVVVGEDCSTDRTRDVLLAYHARHPDVIRMVLPERNLGPNSMYVEVMRVARGEYIAILDGDDHWLSADKLQRQADFLDAHPSSSACFHDMMVVYDDARGRPRPHLAETPRTTFSFVDLLSRPFIPTSALMHRRLTAEELLAWYSEVAPSVWQDLVLIDWITLLLLGRRGHVEYLRGPSAVYRVHDSGVWSSKNRIRQIDEEVAVLRRLTRLADEDHQCLVRTSLARCAVQRAVEQAGLRYDRVVMVLSDPPADPWYFNGRVVSQVNCSEESDEASILLELTRLRRGKAPAPVVPHWRIDEPVRPHAGASVYCVVVSPRNVFQRFPHLRDRLAQYQPMLLAADRCAVYEVPGEDVPERRVTNVRLSDPLPAELHGRHIDMPRPDSVTSGAVLEVICWALPREASILDVQVSCGDQVLGRTATPTTRPDLAEAFPDIPGAGKAGFRLLVDLADLPSAAELHVTAALENGRKVILGTLLTEEASASPD
ncbi:glycosyltransferase [Geodermatophilus sp. SYSU D01105]